MLSPRACLLFRNAADGAEYSVLNLSHLDVLKVDRVFLVLQADSAIRELRVVDIQRFGSVQNNDQMITVRGNLVVIPLVRNEFVLPVGLGSPYDRTRVKA